MGSATVVDVGAVVVVVVVVSTVAREGVVTAIPPSGLHAVATTRSAIPTQRDLYVAVSDDVPENQAPNGSPNDREVLPDCIDGRPISNPKDRCQGYASNNAHENRPDEVVGSGDKATDEPAHGAYSSDDCKRLPDLSIKEHQRQTSGPSYR